MQQAITATHFHHGAPCCYNSPQPCELYPLKLRTKINTSFEAAFVRYFVTATKVLTPPEGKRQKVADIVTYFIPNDVHYTGFFYCLLGYTGNYISRIFPPVQLQATIGQRVT